jgi:hypothetical protein
MFYLDRSKCFLITLTIALFFLALNFEVYSQSDSKLNSSLEISVELTGNNEIRVVLVNSTIREIQLTSWDPLKPFSLYAFSVDGGRLEEHKRLPPSRIDLSPFIFEPGERHVQIIMLKDRFYNINTILENNGVVILWEYNNFSNDERMNGWFFLKNQ